MYFWLFLGYYLGSKRQQAEQSQQEQNPYMRPLQSILSKAFPDIDFSYMD